MNYGIPYMGSKNSIAHIIIDCLPAANNFYDLFCGGCAITNVAMLSRKYKNIHFNDIDADMPNLFYDAIHGKYKDERRWISREDFNRLKDTDAYVKIVWSFGNMGTNYLYGKEIEPYKKAWWYAVLYDDFSLFRKLGINIPHIYGKTYKEKRINIAKWLKKYAHKNTYDNRTQVLERLERLQSLQSLEALERLQRSAVSYDQVTIDADSVIYCDIPYENTAEYTAGSFNHKAFYDWACKQTELCVISSYDISDNRFTRVINLKKNSNLQGGTGKLKNEGLFIPTIQLSLWKSKR